MRLLCLRTAPKRGEQRRITTITITTLPLPPLMFVSMIMTSSDGSAVEGEMGPKKTQNNHNETNEEKKTYTRRVFVQGTCGMCVPAARGKRFAAAVFFC